MQKWAWWWTLIAWQVGALVGAPVWVMGKREGTPGALSGGSVFPNQHGCSHRFRGIAGANDHPHLHHNEAPRSIVRDGFKAESDSVTGAFFLAGPRAAEDEVLRFVERCVQHRVGA